MVYAKSDRQHLLKEMDTLYTMRPQRYPNIQTHKLEDVHA